MQLTMDNRTYVWALFITTFVFVYTYGDVNINPNVIFFSYTHVTMKDLLN